MIGFGLAGTGRITSWVLKGALQDPRFKAVAVCSRNADSAKRFILEHPEAFPDGARIFTSIEEMAACPDIDAVYIGTPNATHHHYTMACLAAGKHVLCEKPMGCSAKEVEEMVEASRKGGKALMEAMIATLNPNFLAARSRISDIGTIHSVFASYLQYSTKYDALKKGTVANSFNPQMGGGALEDIGVYTTFPMVALFGMPDEVKSVRHTVPSEAGDVEVGGSALLSYPGMTASLAWSKTVDAHVPTEICGEGGSLVLDSIHNAHSARLLPHAAPSGGRGPAAEPEILHEGLSMDDYYYEFREFIDVIERGAVESDINSHKVSIDNRRLMDIIKA